MLFLCPGGLLGKQQEDKRGPGRVMGLSTEAASGGDGPERVGSVPSCLAWGKTRG